MARWYDTDRFRRAQQLRRRATPAERRAWDLLRNRRMLGLKFRRQHPIGRALIVDFYCPALRLALEVDGMIHGSPEQYERDEARTRELRSHGVRVLRIANEDVSRERLERLIRPLLPLPPRSPLSTYVERGEGG